MDGGGLDEGDVSALDATYQILIRKASEARASAYCPYSHFRVGAAVLCGKDQAIYSGANVENASYGLTVCAERVTIQKAVSDGHRQFRAMAVACDVKEFTGPCGACRQVLAEFGLNWFIYLVKPDLTWKRVKVSELLPLAFSPESLQKERVLTNSNSPQ
ncbi:cytidine deaminase-like [Liolophura sinensis]|uniref:cytidine deaminase-like n=1 Tax=Liolophura sinensis TaxID=3198878 RepID=UPI003158FBC9